MARILLADDDNAVRGVLLVVLTRAGHQVLAAAGGKEAVEILRSHPVELALLDIEMPGMDGIEVCGWMQQDPLLRGIPVLMMTGRPLEGVLDRIRVVGAQDVIYKPFDRTNLLERIRMILEVSGRRLAD